MCSMQTFFPTQIWWLRRRQDPVLFVLLSSPLYCLQLLRNGRSLSLLSFFHFPSLLHLPKVWTLLTLSKTWPPILLDTFSNDPFWLAWIPSLPIFFLRLIFSPVCLGENWQKKFINHAHVFPLFIRQYDLWLFETRIQSWSGLLLISSILCNNFISDHIVFYDVWRLYHRRRKFGNYWLSMPDLISFNLLNLLGHVFF